MTVPLYKSFEHRMLGIQQRPMTEQERKDSEFFYDKIDQQNARFAAYQERSMYVACLYTMHRTARRQRIIDDLLVVAAIIIIASFLVWRRH